MNNAKIKGGKPPIYEAIANLQKLSELFEVRRAQLAAHAGISEQQWAVLASIDADDFMPSMFARAQATSMAAVSKVLRMLLDKGLVSVEVDTEDGRKRSYELTAEGHKIMQRLRKQREEAVTTVWATLPLARVEEFNAFSAELIPRLQIYVQSAAERGK